MKNHRFWGGFAAGLCSILCIMLLGLASGYHAGSESNLLKDSLKTKTQDSKNEKIFRAKVNLMKEYIDKEYIEDINNETLTEGMYKGMMASLGDRYAAYYTKTEFDGMMDSTNGIYYGIGTVVQQDMSTGIITIVKPYEGGPAYDAGILPGDILYKIDDAEVTGEDLTEVASAMKGKAGSKVKVSVYREGTEEPIDFTIKRRKIEVPTIKYEMLADDIGYISITEFDTVTSGQFIDAVNNLEKQKAKGLIIDLRNNGGGVLDSAVKMLDRMLPKGIVVYQKTKNGKKIDSYAKDDKKYDKPVVILMNENTASASEVFAGAMRDYKAAILVGTTSYGKGIVQSVIALPDGSAMKLTTAKYYTPSGENIHGIGLKPDVEVQLNESLKQKLTIEKAEDNQLQKAIEVILKEIKSK